MRKAINLFMVGGTALMLTACSNLYEKKVMLPSEITMENLDQAIGNSTVIDLRNLEDKFSQGYIKNTELIPFFQILETQGVVVRGEVDGKKTWNAELAIIDPEFKFDAIFPKDETIVMFCAKGVRAEFMKDILISQGYNENLIHNAGAFKDYNGDYLVEATIKFE